MTMKRDRFHISMLLGMLVLLATACDQTIHEYPGSGNVPVLVELNVDRTPPNYYKALTYDDEGGYFEEELTPDASWAYIPDERLSLRFVVELYKVPSAGASVEKGSLVERREIAMDRLALPPQDTVLFYVPEGNYKVLSWADYVPQTSGEDWHFDTGQLNAVRENMDHAPQVNHHKNAAAGSCDFAVTIGRYGETVSVSTGAAGSTASVTPSGEPVVPVYMTRPSARFRLWATDWNDFTRKKSRAVNDLQVKIVYKQYIGVGYNVESESLNAFVETHEMDMVPVTVTDDGSLLLAYDYVLTNTGREDHVLIDVFVCDKNGDEINHYQNIDVPLSRNRETVLKGPFLTREVGSGDIGIDDEFDDEIVVVIPD